MFLNIFWIIGNIESWFYLLNDKDPIDFYINLHTHIKQSSNRIVLSTLYIGTGNLEKYLVA